jgi:uncharacterized MAPEG superfamily protein
MIHVTLPIVIVGVMPYILTLASKSRGFSPEDNKRTRAWQAELTGWRQRAFWAHQNAFEALPLFAALVILAHLARPGSTTAAAAAWTFVAFRCVHAAFYLADLGRPRSAVWMGSQVAQAVLLVVALRAP